MTSVSFVRRNHSVGLNEYHFEWCPKYRYECMRKKYINREFELVIQQAADEHSILIKKIAVATDHVHAHVALPFDLSPSRAIMYLKGRSSYIIFRKISNFRLRYPNGSFWSPGKFIRSMSDVTSGVVDDYIAEQQFDAFMRPKEAVDTSNQLNLSAFF